MNAKYLPVSHVGVVPEFINFLRGGRNGDSEGF